MVPTRLTTRLAQLGGGDPTVLERVRSAQGGFVQMGLVLLSTAGLAVVSMSFALVDGLKAPLGLAVPFGLAWGFIILNIDRFLIKSMRPGQAVWRAIAMMLPRLAMAGLLGMVIATPLVLRIFQDEIQASMREANAQAENELGQTRADSPTAQRLSEVEEQIEANEAVLNGDLPGLTSPNVQAAEERLADAEAALVEKREVAQDAYDDMICELDGRRCHGASGRAGEGPRYDALKRLYDVAAADLDEAQEAVDQAQAALDTASEQAAVSNDESLAEAQERANAELPALYAERDDLQARVGQVASVDTEIQTANTGLLAQVEALDRLGDASPAAARAHWAVAALFLMIELLPVIVKFLTSLGPPSLYDRISALNDDSAFDDAVQQRNHDRRRIEGDSKKRREIEEHMRSLEVRLGRRANTYVAGEMEKILDVALREWSTEVTRTLHTAETGSTDGAQPAGAGPQRPTNAHTRDGAIRSGYGLPSSGQL